MKKNGAIIFIVLAILVFLGVFGVVKLSNTTKDPDKVAEQEAKKLEKRVNKINPEEKELVKGTVQLGTSSLAEELPDISKYPLSVEGNGVINVEIFSSGEKAGEGNDGWLNDMAKKFNQSGAQINGNSVTVSIRQISSGTGADYISSGKYLPDGYTPSNTLWGAIVQAQGQDISIVSDRLVGNVSGVLISNKIKKELEKEYGEASLKTVVQATADGKMAMGYTNPFSSATGLNFLLETLYTYDSENILSDTAIQGFSAFQKNVPFVSYVTMQMREAAASGSLDGMIMEYQTYENDREIKSYQFIPFGLRHDNPLYAVGNISSERREALQMFADFCATDSAQKKATEYGFNRLEDYSSDLPEFDGAEVLEAQNLWKENKDSGNSITAVFVADVSGSMSGAPINELRESLINAAQYINSENSIGLVSYSTDVSIDLPIAKFDLDQRTYFNGAVENMVALGGTATYDGIAVATKMLLDAKAADPDTKLVLFLLSDGQKNQGCDIGDIRKVLQAYQIPVYSIAYGSEADMDELKEVSGINEAAVIDADSDDVVYQLKNLFNAQM